MRRWSASVAVIASLVFAPMAFAEEAVEDQLRAMQEQLNALEDRLQATNDQLESANQQVERQQELIDRAGIADDRVGANKLDAFVDTLEIDGWVAGSYFYNSRKAKGSEQAGFNTGVFPDGVGSIYPFHPDDNSFSVDQLWFGLERPATEEHRGGFRADIVFGKTAGILGSTFGTAADGIAGDETDLLVQQAYAQYLAPIGEGMLFRFGKFETPIGVEVVEAPYNFNITRGNVWQFLQPITHTGISGDLMLGENTNIMVGWVNETRCNACDIDPTRGKALIWSLGWSGDTVSASFNGAWGNSTSGQGVKTKSSDRETIYDVIISWDPNEKFSGYINADWLSSRNSNASATTLTGDVTGYGVAGAGRYAVTERMGLALRAEWLALNYEDVAGGSPDLKIWDLTGTVDYALTDRLMVRAEVRWDVFRQGARVDGSQTFQQVAIDNGFFTAGTSELKDNQLTGGVEVIYEF